MTLIKVNDQWLSIGAIEERIDELQFQYRLERNSPNPDQNKLAVIKSEIKMLQSAIDIAESSVFSN